MKERSIYVIFTSFKDNLWELSRSAHVWISDIEVNRPQIAQVWARDNTYSPNQGVTSFKPGSRAVDKLYELLTTIDEHHTGDGFDWEEMVVQGVDFSEIDENKIQVTLDFKVEVTKEDDFIRIRKMK